MSIWSRIRNVFRGDAVNHELDEEMAAHLEEAAERGRPIFGSTLQQRERSRDIKMLPWLDSLRADVVFGWRQLKKNRSVSIAAVLSLALGIGACTTAFRLIDAVLLRPLPVSDPERLHYLSFNFVDQAGKPSTGSSFAYPQYREFREAAKDSAELMVVSFADRVQLTYGSDMDVEKVYRQYVSGHMFAVFGLKPELGRILTPADDLKPGAHPVAVISHDYWMRRFGGDRNAIGKTFRYEEVQYEIIGVVEKKFTGTSTGTFTDIFLPAMMNARAIEQPGWSWARVFVKLKPEASPKQVQQTLQASFTNQRKELIKLLPAGTPKQRIDAYVNAPLALLSASTGASRTQQDFRQSLIILAAIAALVLLIACANVANLLTAQATARAREMALRVSIGAGRGRLLQLVLVESLLLATMATALGAMFAAWAAPSVVSLLNPPDNPIRLMLDTDWRVLAFGAVLAIAVTFLFGLAPALRASAVKPISALKGGEDPHSRRRLMHLLVAAQVAFCFVVHLVAGLFVSSFDRLSHQPLGFNPDGVLLVETIVPAAPPPFEIWRQVADQLRTQRGVESVAFAGLSLMTGLAWTTDIRVGDRPVENYSPYLFPVSPGWFTTMRMPMVDGRDFRPEETLAYVDGKGEPHDGVAIVNEEFARHYFNGESPIGRSFSTLDRRNKITQSRIVGCVRDARYRDLREPMRAMIYVPFGQREWGTFTVRAAAGIDPIGLSTPLRREISRLRPDFRVSNIRTQSDLVRAQTVRERLLAMLSLFFAIVALALAGVGLYGVLNYSVIQRTREIGIRMALGARASNVVRSVTTEVFGMLALGAVIGLAAGIASERYIESLLFEVKATDLRMLATPAIALLMAALVAALAPALRAIRIDPAQALKAE